MKKKVNVELIYDPNCPNVERTRGLIREALANLGLPPNWREWNRSDRSAPAYAMCYGSPTVLVDGQEVTRAKPSSDPGSCRLYVDRTGKMAGVPPVEAIVAALQARKVRFMKSGSWGLVGGIFGTVAASACCILPLGLVVTGVSGAWAARLAIVTPYRPLFIALALVSLAVAFFGVYRPARAQSCPPDSSCKGPRLRRASGIVLWIASPPLLLLLAFPQVLTHVPGGMLKCGGAAFDNTQNTSEACCALATGRPAPQNSQQRDEPPTPLDPARDIVFQVQNLQCPAVRDVGCGSMLAPVLASLDQIEGISQSFSNWTGDRLRVSVAPGADRDSMAKKVQQVLSVDGYQPIRLNAKQLEQSRIAKWYSAARLVELSSYEFRTIAKRRVIAFADAEGLEAARRQKLSDLVDPLWDSAAQGIKPPGQKPGEYGQYWRSRLDRFTAVYLDRARDVLTPAQMEKLARVYSARRQNAAGDDGSK